MSRALRVITVGRTRRGPLLSLEQDYLGRIGHLAPVAREHVPAGTRSRPEDRRRQEGEALVALLGPKGVHVALDGNGRAQTSAQFRLRLARWRERGEVAFVIGGPDGLDEAVLAACADTVSLGPLTLPHELALIVLLEQLYRALAAEGNHPYTRH